MGTAESDYQLGSNATELQRLTLQGRVLASATRTIFLTAGIRSGMRVLDLGGLDPVRWTFLMSRAETRENVHDDIASETLLYARVQSADR